MKFLLSILFLAFTLNSCTNETDTFSNQEIEESEIVNVKGCDVLILKNGITIDGGVKNMAAVKVDCNCEFLFN